MYAVVSYFPPPHNAKDNGLYVAGPMASEDKAKDFVEQQRQLSPLLNHVVVKLR